MRRFGIDVKSPNTASVEVAADVSVRNEEMDAIRAKRLARFGEVDPADLKQKSFRRRDRKQKKKDKKQFQGG